MVNNKSEQANGGMEILGGLILLDEPRCLPIPWFNRPALGLATNTFVHVGVVHADEDADAPPEIIVTPLDTSLLHSATTMTVDLSERPGALFEVISQMKGQNFNIALEESVTTNQRKRHRTALVLEPTHSDLQGTKEEKETTRARFKKANDALASRLRQLSAAVNWNWVTTELMDFEKEDIRIVEYGRIKIPEILEWIESHYKERFGSRYDFSRVVVSSPTDGRYIRYIFPRRGVFEAIISHRDKPGALAQILQVFNKLKYNILLSRLSRTDPNAGKLKSEFVAICEPVDVATSIAESAGYATTVAKQIIGELGAPPGAYQLYLRNNEISLGKTIAESAAPPRKKPPGVIEISAQTEIRQYITKYKSNQRRPIFVSYRECITKQAFGKLLHEGIFHAIETAGFEPYDGFTHPKPLEDGNAADVRARLYLSGAAVFVAIGDEEKPGLSENQFIEWGYIYGQSKPFALIVRRGAEPVVQRFMIPQNSYITFDPNQATQEVDTAIKELANRISSWRI